MGQNFIQKIRQKPKNVRDNIAFGIASTVTACLLAVWFVLSSNNLDDVVASSKKGAGAFSTFISHVKGEAASVADSLPNKEEIQKAASSSMQESVTRQLQEANKNRTSAEAASSSEKVAAIRIATTTSVASSSEPSVSETEQ